MPVFSSFVTHNDLVYWLYFYFRFYDVYTTWYFLQYYLPNRRKYSKMNDSVGVRNKAIFNCCYVSDIYNLV